jgi:GxxExxY protein
MLRHPDRQDAPVSRDGFASTQRRRDLRDLREGGLERLREASCVALTSRIIELGIRVHRHLGRGLLEAIYEACLCWELRHGGIEHVRQAPLAVTYKDMRLAGAYRADIIVDKQVLLEIKAIERILPVHEAQTLTYVRLGGCAVGLLMNFNSTMLKDGLRRVVR